MNNYKRSAGILMHISSLPSAFGIGDLGPEARSFADFLHRTRQTYWQLLPLNPTEQGQGHSPYSSISSRAGNTLFISPEWLVQHNLLQHGDMQQCFLPKESSVDYEAAERIKSVLFEKAWQYFRQGEAPQLHGEFTDFCDKESHWLNDFALYMLLKQQNEGQPWFNWSEEYKMRKTASLQNLAAGNKVHLEKFKWLQFLFAKQWHELKAYCNAMGIQFLGDLPFYVSYDSVDVWSDRHLFSLDEHANMIGVAGVPPDAFSDSGQLWGMPVFMWDELKKQDYDWWTERLRKNIELYDLLRLDHFRAFADYWEVPAADTTARNGAWKPGPGASLFTAIKKKLGDLPFIAEDLGEINEPVYVLRDAFDFPGMKILQFAFGYEMAQSPHIPHNYSENFVAYTGTHDNNTILGWYREEGCKHYHQLERYAGRHIHENEIPLVMARIVFASVAKIAILPIQDLLGLDENARMNTPASGQNNWKWRLLPQQVTYEAESQLLNITLLYNR